MVNRMIAVVLLVLLVGCATEPNKARDPSGEGLGPTQGTTDPAAQ